MANLQLLLRVLMQEFCGSIAHDISDSSDIDRLQTFCAVTNEAGYKVYQQG